jgi:hypothetical protein
MYLPSRCVSRAYRHTRVLFLFVERSALKSVTRGRTLQERSVRSPRLLVLTVTYHPSRAVIHQRYARYTPGTKCNRCGKMQLSRSRPSTLKRDFVHAYHYGRRRRVCNIVCTMERPDDATEPIDSHLSCCASTDPSDSHYLHRVGPERVIYARPASECAGGRVGDGGGRRGRPPAAMVETGPSGCTGACDRHGQWM